VRAVIDSCLRALERLRFIAKNAKTVSTLNLSSTITALLAGRWAVTAWVTGRQRFGPGKTGVKRINRTTTRLWITKFRF